MPGPCSPRPQRLPIIILLAAAAFLFLFCTATSAATDAEVLLSFRSTLSGGGGGGDAVLADWEASVSPCKGNTSVWQGVLCTDSGAVMGLQLENMSLSGELSLDILSGLPGLRTLSFMNNSLEGPMPDLKKLGSLKSIYLSMNRLSGSIPDDAFTGMMSLKKVHLSQNRFTGPIPTSLAGPPRLLELMLDANTFTGGIPDLRQSELSLVNVSNNDLEGPIPEGLSKMDASWFAGNKGLCGAPLAETCQVLASKKPSVPVVAAIVAIAVGIILSIIGAMLAIARRRQEEMQHPSPIREGKMGMGRPPSSKKVVASSFREDKLEQGPPDDYSFSTGSVKKAATAKSHHDQGKLVFVNGLKGDREKFELQDLLKASAEILPGGSLGSSYKAILLNGPSVVVKRFKEMNAVGREEFQEHMSRLGRLSHPNLLPLLAYYYRREEKLLVTEYTPNGSLAHLLHGNRGMLDWPKRLKIVKGAAQGLVYLYESLRMLGLPHGHLKSSNVILDESYEPLLTDYGLAPVMNQSHATQVMVAYKAPEIRQYGRTTKKSDVWSFGILILEILTGKLADNQQKQQGNKGGMDLPAWVNSIVREEWTGEVFDSGMKGTKNAEGEMLKLLKIGLACCERDVDKRWEMSEALDRIEELKERESEVDDDNSSYVSEVDAYSSRAMSRDDFSFSTNN